MYKPLFENDIICLRCGYWYSPETFIDDEHICNACRKKKNAHYLQTKSTQIMKANVHKLIANIPDDQRDSYVYFLMGIKTQLVKIGYASSNPFDRLKTCQTGSPDILRYLGSIRGPQYVETELHRLLKPYWSHGEWFQFPPGILKFLLRFGSTAINLT